jgi:PAS domain-containing protein
MRGQGIVDVRNQNCVGAVMVFYDVTRRREVEHNLEVSEIRYRRLFEAAHDGILILSASTRRMRIAKSPCATARDCNH